MRLADIVDALDSIARAINCLAAAFERDAPRQEPEWI